MSNADYLPPPPPPVLPSKPFWLSTRFWGLLFAFIGSLLPLMGIGDVASASKLMSAALNALDAVFTFGGLLLAFIGSVRAKQPLAFRFRINP